MSGISGGSKIIVCMPYNDVLSHWANRRLSDKLSESFPLSRRRQRAGAMNMGSFGASTKRRDNSTAINKLGSARARDEDR